VQPRRENCRRGALYCDLRWNMNPLCQKKKKKTAVGAKVQSNKGINFCTGKLLGVSFVLF
jgi:hypothetical protein